MAEAETLTQLTPEELKNLVSLRDTREEVLRELGQQEGREEGLELGEQKARKDIAKKMLELGEPSDKVATLTGLSQEEVQELSAQLK